MKTFNKNINNKRIKTKNKYLINNTKLLENLIKSNSHYGNLLKYSNPKSFNYLIGLRSKQCIINLESTIQLLKRSFLIIEKVLKKKRKHKVLIICNDIKTSFLKKELTNKKLLKRIKFINEDWSGGLLTNPLLSKQYLKNIGVIISFNNVHDNLLIKEANKSNIPLISVANTNIDPNLINYPIIINDNNIKSIFFLTFLFKKFFNNLNI